jgi:hypothetical protein
MNNRSKFMVVIPSDPVCDTGSFTLVTSAHGREECGRDLHRSAVPTVAPTHACLSVAIAVNR